MVKLMQKILIIVLVFFPLFIQAYSEAPVDITNLNVYEINEAIDKGYLTYHTLIKLYLERIEAYNDTYKAIITVNENALKEADLCDRKYKENGRDNVLWCLPIIVKDNIDVVGMPTTAGAYALHDNYPNEDAIVIKKLKAKGMIILAKANMSEFAFQASSSKSYYGVVHNAYNKDYSAYGSSGGSAVSVALNFAPFALGTDTNASLRAPASANNVVGFRSTLKLIDTKGTIAYDITRDVVGPITKTVFENALLMSALTDQEYKLEKNALKGSTIAVMDDLTYKSTTYSEVKRLFDEALTKMEAAGAKIIHLKNVYLNKYAQIEDATMGGWTMCYAFNNYIKNTTSKIKSFYDLANQKTNTYSLWGYYEKCSVSISSINNLEAKKAPFREGIESLFAKYNLDAIIYPNSLNKLLKLNQTGSSIMSSKIAPVLGLPALAVPLGFDEDNLPYGLEFVGLKNSEEKLYNLTYAYESLKDEVPQKASAPSLYEVYPEVETLKRLYEATFKLDSKTRKVLADELTSIRDFFLNYNEFENKSEQAKMVYNDFIKALAKKQFNYFPDEVTIVKNASFNYIGLITYLAILIFLLKFLSLFKPKKN